MIAGYGADGGDFVFLADRDQAIAVDEVQEHRACSATARAAIM
jgi:hypothetical protein